MADAKLNPCPHDYLIVFGVLNFFCFLLLYQINFNCFFGKFIWVKMLIRILIKVLPAAGNIYRLRPIKIYFLISQPKHKLWVLKRTVSIRQLFEYPKQMSKRMDKKIFIISRSKMLFL